RGGNGDGGGGAARGRRRLGLWSSVAWTTLTGHLLAGEERISVIWEGIPSDSDSGSRNGREAGGGSGGEGSSSGGDVWLDMYSVSAPAGVLGKLAWPFVRPMQKAFFQGIAENM
ncbi:unnamed protein product, partial [Phaeothamnion confervicola]